MSEEVLLGTDGRTPLEIKRAAIAAASSGANTVVAAVTGKKIRVMEYVLAGGGTVAATWKSGSTSLSGAMSLVAASNLVGAFTPLGHVETARGEALVLSLSDAVAVGGHLNYLEL